MEDEPTNYVTPITHIPYPRKQDTDKTIKWKIDPNDIITEIINHLRGYKYNADSMSWTSQGYIYIFDAKIPPLTFEKLIDLESKGFLQFERAVYDAEAKKAILSVFDNQSFSVVVSVLNSSKAQYSDIDYNINRIEPQRLVNETGLRVISTQLRGYLNKNIILSNFEGDRGREMINNIAMDNAMDVIKLLYTCHEKYDIKKENLSIILRIIDVNVYSTLLRAKDGFFVHHLDTTQRYIEHNTTTIGNSGMGSPQSKSRFFPSLFGNWFGGN